MVKNKFHIFLFLIAGTFAFALPGSAFSQKDEIAALEKKRDNLDKEIQAVSKLIEATRSDKEKTFGELKLLVKQMELRQSMMAHLSQEIRKAGSEIERASITIQALEDEITEIQNEFSRLARAVYLGMHPHSESFYFFSSESMTEGYYEIQYFREFSDYLRRQVKLIRRTRKFLSEEREYLDEIQEEKTALSTAEEQALQGLKVSKKEKDEVYKKVKNKEAEYKATQKAKIAAWAKMDEEIKAFLKGRVGSEVLHPLSGVFKQNKGKLPWPINASQGVIVTHFGRQLIDGTDVEVDVNGIDITTSKGQPVRTIFEGEVQMVKKVPMHGHMIIIQHGNYYTLYSDIENPSVSKGDKVAAMETIGVARTDKTSNETKVHFELFLDATPINPEEWITRR